jgi:hypothetical protein
VPPASSRRELNYSFIGIGSGDRDRQLRKKGANHIFPNYEKSQDFFATLKSFKL